MILSLLSVVLMGGLFLLMINKAKVMRARRMAGIPLAACILEILAAGMLHPLDFPVLTLLLVALRLVIVGCCVGAMREDAAMARRRDARKKELTRALRNNVTVFPTRDARRMAPRRPSRCA